MPAAQEAEAGVHPVASTVPMVDGVVAGAYELLAHAVHTRFAKRVAADE